MENAKRTTVVGVFESPDSARDAIQALKDSGFDAEDIGVLMKDRERARDVAEETGSRASEGALTGAIGGGLLGGLAGWLVGIGSLAIPGIGPFIAAGAFGTALAGAGIGAGVGAVGGALVGMGIPKEEADWYEGEVRKGRTLVTVKADGRYGEAHSILSRFGAYDIENRYAGRSTTSSAGVTTGVSAWDGGVVNPKEPRVNERWEDVEPDYHARWHQRFGTSGQAWDDEAPSYRFGWEMRNRPEYRGRNWNDVEPEFRRDWENRHRDRPWERSSESVRNAWEDDADFQRMNREYEDSRSGYGSGFTSEGSSGTGLTKTSTTGEGRWVQGGDYEVVGGEGFPPHEHRFVGERCEVCGATKRYRRAA